MIVEVPRRAVGSRGGGRHNITALGVVRMAINVAMPEYAAEFGDRVRNGHLRLPSYKSLQWAKVRLDLQSMLWQQRLQSTHHVVSYVMLDSSPQFGWNFLVGRTDDLVVAASACTSVWRTSAAPWPRGSLCLLVDVLPNQVSWGNAASLAARSIDCATAVLGSGSSGAWLRMADCQ